MVPTLPRWKTIRDRNVCAHDRGAYSFQLDVVRVVLSTANYGLHATVLDLVMVPVACYHHVELTWNLPFRSRHNVADSSKFVEVLFQFVVVALLGSW